MSFVLLVVSFKLDNYDLYWSISSANDQRLTENLEGKLYVGEEATTFCMKSPGLDGNKLSTSLQLFGHTGLYVNVRSSNEIYLDRADGTLEFGKYRGQIVLALFQ